MLDATAQAMAGRLRSSVGEPPDLEQIFARYVDPVHRFIYSRVGNREDAEDLTSEVFLKATRMLDSERSEASVAKWLFTVARTVLADHWRKYYRTGTSVPLDDARLGDMPESAPEPGPTEASTKLVEEVLTKLPERYRNVLERRFLLGYSIQETADELGISGDNVKVIQHRALAKAVQIVEYDK
ncbi:MAG TPA: sigma-70 family RNA polymerase sigma factor [Chloroflexota bacterium]|nr:sigma-70 family RNA polymerase sigma factor [Chloroflexota bacterium]